MTLLEKLKHAASQRQPVQLGDACLCLRLLTEQDYATAGLAAHQTFADITMTATSAELYERHLANELLALAVLDAEDGQPAFASASQLATTLTREQKAYLLEEYLAFEREFSPARMTDEAFLALLDEVKKTPQTTRLNDSSTATLKRLVRCLASPPSP
ncbi:hypothetical protein [Aquitalea pelogenes]|uniref:hypothetical protein n=1 Tax=Aquitalea pelogenes TaxID=1293573 RepID=UPI0007870C27|nr:hypothetical protein [Aquitalea pelogenes]